jgi:hypothetical protein
MCFKVSTKPVDHIFGSSEMKNAVSESSLPTSLFPTGPARDATYEYDTVLWIVWCWLMDIGLGEIYEYWFYGAYFDVGTQMNIDSMVQTLI